jgi:AcrR family transcriptional regulator
MPRPKQRTPALRQQVLAAALQMLEAEGAAALTAKRVAAAAGTSVPAVYEMFGAKGGLVRELFFEGFRQLRRALDAQAPAPDPRSRLAAMVAAIRGFAVRRRALAELMFSRPIAAFEPGAADAEAGNAVREFIVGRIREGIGAGLIAGDPTDIAHVLLATAQGLALQESARWLGRSKASADRRWRLAVDALLGGLAPQRPPPRARRRSS